MTSPSSVIPRGVGDRVLAVPPHLHRPNGRPRWSLTVTGRRGSEGVTVVYASRSWRLASGAAGADRFSALPATSADVAPQGGRMADTLDRSHLWAGMGGRRR